MNQYFELLDLSPTTTRAEIKSQYQLLLRVYNPQRFASPEDKNYVEYMRKKLGEAYRMLMGSNWATPDLYDETTLPRVEPALIDWGRVNYGDRLAAQVRIYTAHRPQRLLLTPNDAANWLTVGCAERIEVAGNEVVAFEVTANTRKMAAGKKYSGQIAAAIDDVTHYVFVMMKIEPTLLSWPVGHSWLHTGATHLQHLWGNHS